MTLLSVMNHFNPAFQSWAPILWALWNLSGLSAHNPSNVNSDGRPVVNHDELAPQTDRVLVWNNVRYILPIPLQYRFFDESVFGYQTIPEFTLTPYQPLTIVDFDLLVPDSIGMDPFIHIYTFDLIRDVTVSMSDFSEYKSEWIMNLGNGTFNVLAELVWSSDAFKKRFPNVNPSKVEQKNFAILSNEKDRLTYLMCIGDNHSNHVITYTHHLHINGTVVFIKAWLSRRASVDDVLRSVEITDRYIDAFLSKNVKLREY